MKRHLLIVDDDATIRHLLQMHFTSLGYISSSAASGEEALVILGCGQVHVLITDIEMPDMDGITLLRSVRIQGLCIRSVVVTGYASLDNLMACLREGALALVPKPLDDLADLDQAIDMAFRQMERWAGQMNAILGLRSSSGQSPSIDGPRDAHAQ